MSCTQYAECYRGYLLANPAPGSLSNVYSKNGVAPVRLLVEVVHGRRTHEFAGVKQIERLLLRFHLDFREPPDENTPPTLVLCDGVISLPSSNKQVHVSIQGREEGKGGWTLRTDAFDYNGQPYRLARGVLHSKPTRGDFSVPLCVTHV